MRPDFLLHLSVTIILLFAFTKLFGWKKAVLFTLTLQVGKEAFDYYFNQNDFDPADWLGDFLGFFPFIIYLKFKSMKKTIILSVLAVVAITFFASTYWVGGFATTAPKNLLAGSYQVVHQPLGSTTGVLTNSYHYSLVDFVADVSNSGTSETDIFTHTSAANTLAATGDKLIGSFSLSFPDATATVEIKAYFAGTSFFGSNAITLTGAGFATLNLTVIRTGSTTARAYASLVTGVSATPVYARETDLTGLTFSGTNIIKVTGTAAGGGGGSGDIVGKAGSLTFASAAQ